MLAKCANPDCSTRFLYLRDGKLFRIEVSPDGHAIAVGEELAQLPFVVPRKPARRVEHYWLCRSCADCYVVAYDANSGVKLLPRGAEGKSAHAAAS